MSSLSQAPVEPRRRLHPLSPLLRSARLIGLAIVAISWRGYAQLGTARFLEVVLLVLLGIIVLSIASWWFTGYHVVGRELRVYEGLLRRRVRAIPLERLQAVNLVRPVLAQAVGLAELRLEVVGGDKAEAPLAYLTVDEAVRLRDRLLALSSQATATRPGVAGGVPQAPPDQLVHAVTNADVVTGQLLTPQVWFVPVGVLAVLAQFAYSPEWTFVGVASLITAAVGVLQQPVRRVLDDWDFRLATSPDGLRLHHGLLDKRNETVPPHRVQAVGVTWPLLWRPKAWLRCRIDVAGYGPTEGRRQIQAGRLLPVGTMDAARLVVRQVWPEVELTALAVTPSPTRARWLAPLRQFVLGAGLTDTVFVSRDGLLTRELVVVPYARIQSVRVVQGPLARLLRLATVHADTAGRLHAIAHLRDVDEAWELAAQLTERARAARSAG